MFVTSQEPTSRSLQPYESIPAEQGTFELPEYKFNWVLPNISSSVIKLPIIIITDYTITDHTITDWSYYFSVPKVFLPISTITICFYPELYYYR